MTPIGKWTWKGALRWLKSGLRSIWPFADRALEMAKPALLRMYDKAVDGQQEKLVAVLKKKGPLALSKAYDAMQKKICDTIQKAKLVPQKWRDAACLVVEDEGDVFQKAMLPVIEARGVSGLNALIDDIQETIKARLKAL